MIENLIITQLIESGKVLIPGVGTFIKKDGATLFISFLKSDDGLFAKNISSSLSLSDSEAAEVVSAYAQSILSALSLHGFFAMSGLGTLKYDVNGVVVFEVEFNTPKVADAVIAVDLCSADVISESIAESVKVAFESDIVESTKEPEPICNITEPTTEQITSIPVVEQNMVEDHSKRLNDLIGSLPNFNDEIVIEKRETLAERLMSEPAPKTLADRLSTTAVGNTTPIALDVVVSKLDAGIIEENPIENIAKDIVIESVQSTTPIVESIVEQSVELVAEESTESGIELSPEKPVEHDTQLLNAMKDASSKKDRLYDLYQSEPKSNTLLNSSSSASQKAGKDILTEKKMFSGEPAKNITVRTNPNIMNPQPVKRSGPDFVIIISVIAIVLAILVSLYYFFIRG